MIEYTIVTEESPGALSAAVNVWIADGWLPLGGVSVSTHHASWENERKGYTESETVETYAQAMTRTAATTGGNDGK